MTRYKWSQEQEEFIIALIGYYPVKYIISLLKRQYRLGVSDLAIKAKIEKVARISQERIRDRVDNYSMSALSRFLGVRDIVIRRWINSGLKAKKCGGLWIIKHKDVVEFSKANPRRFRQVSKVNLEWLFEDDMAWVDFIVNSKPLKPLRPVLCVTTGKVYPSLRCIEFEMNISRDRIKTYIESGLPTKVDGKYLTFKWAG